MRDLQKNPKLKKLDSFFLFFGDDQLSREKAINLYQKSWEENNVNGEVEIIDGSASNSEEVINITKKTLNNVRTTSMFGDSRLVHLKNITFFGSNVFSKSQSAKESQEQFLKYFTKILENSENDNQNYLILSGDSFDKRTSFSKHLIKSKKIKFFNLPDENDRNWEAESRANIISIAKSKGLSFSKSDNSLDLFINLIGVNRYLIDKELEKVSIYLNDKKEITCKVVEDLISKTHHAIIFSIGQSLAKKDIAKTFNLIKEVISSGESPISILNASILPTVRNILYGKVLINLNSGNNFVSYNSLTSFVNSLTSERTRFLPKNKKGQLNLYPVWLNLNYAKNFKLNSLQRSLRYCLEVNQKFVSEDTDGTLLLYQLIPKIIL